MKKRIVSFMNAYTQGESGGDIWFIEVAKRLKEFDWLVVTSRLGKDLCQRKGLVADYLITTREIEFKGVVFIYLRRIFKVLFKRIQGDMFYATSDFLPDVLPAFLGKIHNPQAKWVQRVFHIIPPSRPIPHWAQRISFIFIKRWASLVFVDNCLLKERLINKGFSREKIIVSYPGIDIEFIQRIEPNRDGFDGVFLGRIKPSKGIFDLIGIWDLVCKKRPGSRLGVIGYVGPKMRDVFEKRVSKLGLKENIFLLGYLDDDKAIGIMKASKVFLFPSHEEGFGIAIAEAIACGLPVVAYALPIYRDIFGNSIVGVSMGDVEAFAVEVVRLLEKGRTPLDMEVVKNFSWDRTVEREIYYLCRV